MAVWTAEALPAQHQVDGIILLAAALSPEYELAKALHRTRRGIVSFHSRVDYLFLGMGTTIAGTMDGRHTSAAGRLGFLPSGGQSEPARRQKLYQIPWRGVMRRSGHWGGHTSSSSEGFIRDFVSPLVVWPHWDRAFVHHLAGGDILLSADVSPTAGPHLYGRF